MSLFKTYKDQLKYFYKELFSEKISESDFLKKFEIAFDKLENELSKKNTEITRRKLFIKSTLFKILKTCQRLFLIKELKDDKINGGTRQFLYPGLITYLMLTCFDQLGQSKTGFLPFNSWLDERKLPNANDQTFEKIKVWLKSEDLKESVEDKVNENAESFIDFVKTIYSDYNAIHGVKISFFYFLDNILPNESREKLLNSIDIVKKEIITPKGLEITRLGDIFKKKWLFQIRNDFTHNLESKEKHYAKGFYLKGGAWIIMDEVKKEKSGTQFLVNDNFKDIIHDSILIGMISLLDNYIKNEKY